MIFHNRERTYLIVLFRNTLNIMNDNAITRLIYSYKIQFISNQQHNLFYGFKLTTKWLYLFTIYVHCAVHLNRPEK